MPFPSDLLLFQRDAAFGAGLWRRVFATVWRESPTVEQLRTCGAFQDQVTRRCGDGFVALAVLPSAATRMAPHVREAAEELSRSPSPALVAIAQVITGTGFVAATTRMIAMGMTVLNRGPAPTRLFDSVDHASLWVAQKVAAIPGAEPIQPSEIVAAFVDL